MARCKSLSLKNLANTAGYTDFISHFRFQFFFHLSHPSILSYGSIMEIQSAFDYLSLFFLPPYSVLVPNLPLWGKVLRVLMSVNEWY